MIQSNKKNHHNKSQNKFKDIENFKDNDLSPKGVTKHQVETDWPVKEASTANKKRKIKKTAHAKLP